MTAKVAGFLGDIWPAGIRPLGLYQLHLCIRLQGSTASRIYFLFLCFALLRLFEALSREACKRGGGVPVWLRPNLLLLTKYECCKREREATSDEQ